MKMSGEIYSACVKPAKQKAFSQTLHGEDKRGENERQGENDCEMKPLARSRGRRTDKS